MARVLMYTTAVCPYCVNAKKLLAQKGVAVEEIRVDSQPQLRQEMMTLRIQKASGQLENPARITLVRRAIARTQTLLSQHRLGLAAQ